MLKYLIIICFSIFTLVSCGTIESRIITTGKVNQDDDIGVIAGEEIQSKTPNKILLFSSVGETHNFKRGDIVEVITQGINFEDNTFYYTFDKNSDLISMSLKPREACDVKLINKCAVVTWNDPNNIPTIKLADNMKPEQIIITPLFDEDCQRSGYQIRYGSTERGCYSVAKKVLEDFRECIEKNKVRPTKNTPTGEIITIWDAIAPQRKKNNKKK